MSKGKSNPPTPDRTDFVDMRELLRRWPVSRATVYRAIKRGELAPPVRISKRRVAWPAPVIEQFLRALAGISPYDGVHHALPDPLNRTIRLHGLRLTRKVEADSVMQ